MTTPMMTQRMKPHHVSLVSQVREAAKAKAKDTTKTDKNHYVAPLAVDLQV